MDYIYTAISWILLRWHGLWDAVLPDGAFLGTNWEWILSIVFLVITVRVILFPIFVKQIKSQRAMQALQPKIKELQAKHKGDRESMQKELMELYRTEKANPLMGCLPMFLQIPVFLGLFHVLKRVRPGRPENMQTLYGWTADQFESAANATLFKAPIPAHFTSSAEQLADLNGSGVTVKIVAGFLVAIMIVTTYMTSRQMILKTGWSEDPQQRMIQKLMLYGIPFSLLISGGLFPIGVVIYWVTTNLFSLGQQFWVLRKYPPPKMSSAGTSYQAMSERASGSAASRNTPAKPASKNPFGLGSADRNRTENKAASNGKASKPNLNKGKKADDAAAPPTKVQGPRVGAKPVRNKKGGTARRPSSG
ncbi:membrane protein insertase YidC [Virgisporangium ochraceum]|uniref:Membrane protein insertase YidC n=1 Tax=Virgisporangium ochraceum TaxID=65505 RepID=A0A8J4EBV0_9ACTN|nr:membrane protein insertase YidC [Virgisporangium ochraceum]GIJ66207.1 membrane protein insertase YidC [Virgisporangium ochraceum]